MESTLLDEVEGLGKVFYMHSNNVRLYGVKMLEILKQKEQQFNTIETEIFETALLLHDIGKQGIPKEILYKNGSLTTEERNIMNRHPDLGVDVLRELQTSIEQLKRLSCDELKIVEEVIRYHHENVDGTGYNQKLQLKEIPVTARIAQIADVFDSITSDRPYRRGKNTDEAIKEIKRVAGKQLDKRLVDILTDRENIEWVYAATPYRLEDTIDKIEKPV